MRPNEVALASTTGLAYQTAMSGRPLRERISRALRRASVLSFTRTRGNTISRSLPRLRTDRYGSDFDGLTHRVTIWAKTSNNFPPTGVLEVRCTCQPDKPVYHIMEGVMEWPNLEAIVNDHLDPEGY